MLMEQREAIEKLAKKAQDCGALVVSEIGSQTVWLHDTGDHPSYLYLSGPMGMAPSVALGVAMAHPKTPVLALCGDGSLAMNFTSLVTISHIAPANLTFSLMKNDVYDFTGQVESPSKTVNWGKMLGGLEGFKNILTLDEALTRGFSANSGLSFIICPVRPTREKAAPFPFSGPQVYERFETYCTNLEKP